MTTDTVDTSTDDIFAKIAASQATFNGAFIRDGSYLLAIDQCKCERGFKGDRWVTNFIVLAAKAMPGMYEIGGQPCFPNGSVVAVGAPNPGAVLVEPNEVGEKIDFVAMMKQSSAAGNVKSFFLALSGVNEKTFNAREKELMAQGKASEFLQSARLLCSPSQPFRGALIRCTTQRKENQGRDVPANKGKLIVSQNWTHVPSDGLEAMKARAAQIVAGQPVTVPAHLLA